MTTEQNIPTGLYSSALVKRQYECYICKIKLNGWMDTKKHVKRHIQARNKKCHVCDEMCTEKELTWHICGAEKSIQCEYCCKSFGKIVKLVRHIEAEHKAEKILHRCGKCYRFFELERLRDLHETHAHAIQFKDKEKLHVCKICAKAFPNIEALIRHANRHSNKSTCMDDYYAKCSKMINIRF